MTENEKAMKDSQAGRAEYQRGQRLGRRINRTLDKCSVYLTPDLIDALRLAIASELLKIERINAPACPKGSVPSVRG